MFLPAKHSLVQHPCSNWTDSENHVSANSRQACRQVILSVSILLYQNGAPRHFLTVILIKCVIVCLSMWPLDCRRSLVRVASLTLQVHQCES